MRSPNMSGRKAARRCKSVCYNGRARRVEDRGGIRRFIMMKMSENSLVAGMWRGPVRSGREAQ